jgi:hypothetical protein
MIRNNNEKFDYHTGQIKCRRQVIPSGFKSSPRLLESQHYGERFRE